MEVGSHHCVTRRLCLRIYVDECRNVIITKVRSGVVDRSAGQRALSDVLFLPDQIGAAVTDLVFDLAITWTRDEVATTQVISLWRSNGATPSQRWQTIAAGATDLGLVVFS
jgi:hypothetical protein